MKKWLAVGVLGLVALAGVALAQNPGVGGINITSPVGTEQINAENAGPQITWVYLSQLRDTSGFQSSSPTSGTVTFGANSSLMGLYTSSTITSLTIALTAAPQDGQNNCWWNKVAITTLTMSVTSSQTLNDALTSTSATTRYCYTYTLSSKTWNRTL